jgi:hypothetical protein
MAIAVVALLASCDLPSSPPQWDTRWVVPAESTTVGLPSLLPSGIAVSTDGTELLVTVPQTAISESLGSLCPVCAAANGMTVPKPAFTTTVIASTTFPADIDSVTLTRGSFEVRVTNGFSFDPIRPSSDPADPRGSFTITVRSAGVAIATRVIDGAVKALPPGQTVVDTIAFDPSLLPRAVGSPLETSITIDSPAGDPVTIDTSDSFTVLVMESIVGISGAQVRVAGRAISSAPVSLDLEDIDTEVADRVKGGALLLEIDNPFAVGGSVTATLSAPGLTLTWPVTIAPGASEPELPFTGEDLRSLFGTSPVTLSFTGTVDGVPAGGLVSVTPDMVLTVRSHLQLDITTEGLGDGQ